MYASIIDDEAGKVICSASSLKLKGNSVEGAKKVGEEIAKLAKKNKIETVSFDRNGFIYHGKISALADSARENGLTF
jgi:large subunit ribosomal protein L18